MQGGLCGLFMCHNSNLLRSELSVEVLFYSDMSDTKKTLFSSLHALTICLLACVAGVRRSGNRMSLLSL